ncbi:MAG: hypothetical protein Q9167_006633 [Letrouitia subvulpina]
MHFSSPVIALAAIIVAGLQNVAAMPHAETMTLWNGTALHNVTLGGRDWPPFTKEEHESSNSSALEPRFEPSYKVDGEKVNCKGSMLCYHDFIGPACEKAVTFIEERTMYKAGKTNHHRSSGVCHKNNCGIFIQAWKKGTKGCEIAGRDLRASYNIIRKEGRCKHCGQRRFPDGCAVKMDFVTHCPTPFGGYPFGASAGGGPGGAGGPADAPPPPPPPPPADW